LTDLYLNSNEFNIRTQKVKADAFYDVKDWDWIPDNELKYNVLALTKFSNFILNRKLIVPEIYKNNTNIAVNIFKPEEFYRKKNPFTQQDYKEREEDPDKYADKIKKDNEEWKKNKDEKFYKREQEIDDDSNIEKILVYRDNDPNRGQLFDPLLKNIFTTMTRNQFKEKFRNAVFSNHLQLILIDKKANTIIGSYSKNNDNIEKFGYLKIEKKYENKGFARYLVEKMKHYNFNEIKNEKLYIMDDSKKNLYSYWGFANIPGTINMLVLTKEEYEKEQKAKREYFNKEKNKNSLKYS